jgi:hypothetical protein
LNGVFAAGVALLMRKKRRGDRISLMSFEIVFGKPRDHIDVAALGAERKREVALAGVLLTS